MRRQQRGVTLVELMVVLLVLGLLSGVSVLAVGALRRPAESERAAAWRRARAAAIRSGQAVTVEVDSARMIRFLPDGRVVGVGVDPFTGEVPPAVSEVLPATGEVRRAAR